MLRNHEEVLVTHAPEVTFGTFPVADLGTGAAAATIPSRFMFVARYGLINRKTVSRQFKKSDTPISVSVSIESKYNQGTFKFPAQHFLTKI
jgi:hypothetical protein